MDSANGHSKRRKNHQPATSGATCPFEFRQRWHGAGSGASRDCRGASTQAVRALLSMSCRFLNAIPIWIVLCFWAAPGGRDCSANSRVRTNRNAIDFRVKRKVLDRRFELITTITRVTRILVLALFFVSVVDFSLDSARFDLVVMTAALAIFLSGGLRSP